MSKSTIIVITENEDKSLNINYKFAPAFDNNENVHLAGVKMIELFTNDASVKRYEPPLEKGEDPK